MLDAWASERRINHNIPLYQVPLLEAVCDTDLLSNWLASSRNGRIVFGRELLNAELGRLVMIQEELKGKINQVKAMMLEMDKDED